MIIFITEFDFSHLTEQEMSVNTAVDQLLIFLKAKMQIQATEM